MLLSLTTEWKNLNGYINENSGFFVSGGNMVEYLSTPNTPLSTDKGSMISRGNFCNIFKDVPTYVRAPLPFGTSAIVIEPTYFNYKDRIIQSSVGGYKLSLNLEELKFSISGLIPPSTLDLNTLITLSVSYLTEFGYKMVSGKVGSSSLLHVVAPTFTIFEVAVLIIEDKLGKFRLHRTRDMVQIAGNYLLHSGTIILEIQEI